MQISVDYHHRLCSRAPGGVESRGIVPGGVSPYERVGPPPWPLITIINIFENLRLGRRCGLFARLFLHGFRVPPGGVRPVAFASSTKMRRWRWHVFNEKRKKKKQKLAKLGNGEPVTTPLSSVVRKLNKIKTELTGTNDSSVAYTKTCKMKYHNKLHEGRVISNRVWVGTW
jgi:hypothetical protein